jgi:hypothetical protein
MSKIIIEGKLSKELVHINMFKNFKIKRVRLCGNGHGPITPHYAAMPGFGTEPGLALQLG